MNVYLVSICSITCKIYNVANLSCNTVRSGGNRGACNVARDETRSVVVLTTATSPARSATFPQKERERESGRNSLQMPATLLSPPPIKSAILSARYAVLRHFPSRTLPRCQSERHSKGSAAARPNRNQVRDQNGVSTRPSAGKANSITTKPF